MHKLEFSPNMSWMYWCQNWKTPLSHTSVLSSVVWHGPFVFSREWDNNVHFLVPSTQTLCTTITSKETYFYIQYRRQLLALLRSVQCCGGRWGDVIKCQVSFLGVVQLGSTASRVSQWRVEAGERLSGIIWGQVRSGQAAPIVGLIITLQWISAVCRIYLCD